MHPAISLSQAPLNPSVKIPRIAVLGCGSIGRRHLANLYALGARDLIVFDPEAGGMAEEIEKYPGLIICTQLEQVWAANPWTVLIASPSGFHLEQTRQALEAGCHVFVEKPLAGAADGLEDLAALAEKSGNITMVACNMRFHPGPAFMHERLQQQAIGQLLFYRLHIGSYLPQWRPHQDYRKSYSASVESGGAILDCIHELDLALWYAGPGRLLVAKSIPARSIGLQTDGLAEILLEHESGTLGSIHLNFIERDYRRSCIFIGTEGTLEWNFAEKVVLEYGREKGKLVHALDESWQLNQMYVDELRYFLHCALQNQPAFNSIRDNLLCLRIALDARPSS